MDVNGTLPRFLLLLRFLCFVAVVYLAMHTLFARLISKRESKVLWFFSTLTRPLIWPIRVWLPSEASDSRLRFLALVFYCVLWLLVLVATAMVTSTVH